MKLHLQRAQGRNLISGYASDSVTVNDTAYHASLIVAPDWLLGNWRPDTLSALRWEDFGEILAHEPEILLLGTGKTLRFPKSSLLKEFGTRQLGLEVMDTAAACRTYNILMGEDRHVIAALLIT